MARRPLKPQLNQIRAWVREGRTDAWIAHQLEVTAKDIDAFKREHTLDGDSEGDAEAGATGSDSGELDLRAEDDALVAAALEAEPEEEPDDEVADSDEPGAGDASAPADESDEAGPRKRRRGRRGGRGRRGRGRRPLEGTFDHGEEGYGLWLDPALRDDAVYAEHWAGHRSVAVTIEADRIVIRRAGEDTNGSDAEG